MSASTKKLILYTSGFPYGKSETFLETEITFLASCFSEVIIVAVDGEASVPRTLPSNCRVLSLSLKLNRFDRLIAFFSLIDIEVRKEIKSLKLSYGLKLNWGILKTILISWFRANQVQKHANNLLKAEADKDMYLYSYWADDVAIGLARLKKNSSVIKRICRAHGWDVYFERSVYGYLPFREFLKSHLDAVYAISENGSDYIEKRWGGKYKGRLARLGVKNQTAFTTPNDKGIFTVFSCSSLIPLKRVHIIAEALKGLNSNLEIRWVHLGDGSERQRIEEILKDLPKSIEVIFKGQVSNDEVIQFYKDYRPELFLNVSETEGIPVSIMEAMSFGIPVLATNVGGNSEIVSDSNGWLVTKDIESTELTLLLEEIIEKGTGNKSDGALATWREKYNAEVNYSGFVQELISD